MKPSHETAQTQILPLLVQGLKVSRFYGAFCPWGLESEVTFAQDIPYEQVHEYH